MLSRITTRVIGGHCHHRVAGGAIITDPAKASEKSRSAPCASNLLQWGLAFRLHADDNDDYLPRRGQGIQALFQIDRPTDWFNALPLVLLPFASCRPKQSAADPRLVRCAVIGGMRTAS